MRVHRSPFFSFPLSFPFAALASLTALAVMTQLGGCGTSGSPANGGGTPVTRATSVGAEYVRVARGAHPLARAEYDVGALDPNKRIANLSIVFKPTPQQRSERDALRDALTDPTSPSYHQWLTTAQYKARFGARADDIARTSAWLAQQGLEVHAPSPLGARVRFSGRVADLETAFHAEMRQYRVGDETHYAMSTAPSVPADLADVVLGVQNTHDFHALAKPRPLDARPLGKTLPLTSEGSAQGLAPADWASVYDVTRLYSTGVKGTPIDGTGVNIAVVGVQALAQSDVDAFRKAFGLPQSTFTSVLVPDTGPAATSGGNGVEAALDVEWAGSIAPGAHVDYFNLGVDDQSEQNDAAYYAIEQNTDAIITESFAYCEAYYAPSDQDIWDAFGSAANLLGITYVAASGDSGAAGCTPWSISGLWTNSPASFPGVTAVGGTEFPNGTLTYGANGIATGYNAGEVVWHELAGTTHIGGGGGISSVYSRPAYQSLIPTCTPLGTLPTNANPATMRQVPDVAVSAGSIGNDNPYWMACTVANGDCSASGGTPAFFQQAGTSASAPSFAGVVALIAQATGGRLGNINPMLYSLASTTPSAFHDITTGNNRIECTSADLGCPTGAYGYEATTGYDCATGLGSIDAYNLVSAWAARETTTTTIGASPTALSEGTSVALTASVDVAGADAHALGGSVTFAFDSYHADGTVDLSWNLGVAPVVGGIAQLSTTVPVGFARASASELVDVVAEYGGDAYHLASTSAKARLTYAPSSFCISPSSATLDPGNTGAFVGASGGLPMQKWLVMVDQDGTCDFTGANCSSIDATTGVFTAGQGSPGYVLVYGFDQFNTYSVAYVTVGNPSTPPPWGDTAIAPCGTNVIGDGGAVPVIDAGPTAEDAGPSGDDDAAPPTDASVSEDASPPVDAAPQILDASDTEDAGKSAPSSSSGCSCTAAPDRQASGGVAASLVLGLGLLARRRARRRVRGAPPPQDVHRSE